MKIVVVGINHAGTSAIRTLLTQNPDHEVVAYDRNDNISFLGCGIALTVSGIVKNVNDLFYSSPTQLSEMGAKIFMKHDVTQIDTKAKKVYGKNLESASEFEDSYDKLIYAAGSWPISIPIENENLDNVHICKLFQHAQTLIKLADEPTIENVAVIGAGYIGIELAEAYMKKGKNVTLIDMEDRVVPKYFDKDFTDRLEASIRVNEITLALGEKVQKFDGDGTRVKKVITDKNTYKADLVIKCIGFSPNSKLLPEADKIKSGAIIIDEYAKTSIEDVYAVGDCASIYNAATQSHTHTALATNAVKSGVVAASNINGVDIVKLESVAGTNAICVFENNLSSTGLSEEAATKLGMNVASSTFEDNDRPEFMEDYKKVKIKLVFDKETLRLVGAQVGSYGKDNVHTEAIYYLGLAIQKNMNIVDVALSDVYFLPHFNKPFNFVIGAVLQALNLNYFNK